MVNHDHIATLTDPMPDPQIVPGMHVRILRGEFTGTSATVTEVNETFVTVSLTPGSGKAKGKPITETYMHDEVTLDRSATDTEPDGIPAVQPQQPDDVDALRQKIANLESELAHAAIDKDDLATKFAQCQKDALKAKQDADFAKRKLESERAINESLHRRLSDAETRPVPVPAAPASKQIEVRTLVQILFPPERRAAADDEMAAHLNEGWRVMDISITSEPISGSSLTMRHTRVVTLRRRSTAPAPLSVRATAEVPLVATYPANAPIPETPVYAGALNAEALPDRTPMPLGTLMERATAEMARRVTCVPVAAAEVIDEADAPPIDDEAAPDVIVIDSPNLTPAQNEMHKHEQLIAEADDMLASLRDDMAAKLDASLERMAAAQAAMRQAGHSTPNRYSAQRA
jgi:hypothetical protein